MRYAQIRNMDIINGKGIGVSVFFQGCSHHCKNCFNTLTWDFNSGKEWTKEIENSFIKSCQCRYVDHVSFLGGEPFDQDIEQLYDLLKRIKDEVDKPIWIWTGYTLDEIKKSKSKESVLKFIDYLIDGRFVDSKKDLSLKYRGSSNQRIYKNINSKTMSKTMIDITDIIDNNFGKGENI